MAISGFLNVLEAQRALLAAERQLMPSNAPCPQQAIIPDTMQALRATCARLLQRSAAKAA